VLEVWALFSLQMVLVEVLAPAAVPKLYPVAVIKVLEQVAAMEVFLAQMTVMNGTFDGVGSNGQQCWLRQASDKKHYHRYLKNK